MLKENYEEVQKKITEACKRAGRNREEVTLIADKTGRNAFRNL